MSKPILSTHFKIPKESPPIFCVGAGGIVGEAHLPAYTKAKWHVQGIFDVQHDKARRLQKEFNLPKVYSTLKEMLADAPSNAVFDIAVPADRIFSILQELPKGAAIMMQKPMGENLEQAKKIYAICMDKKFVASVNFQMKFIPSVIAAKKLIDQGLIGELHDMEIRMNIYHPWELWDFLFGIPRMEMLYHSIHYMDMIRYFLGMPERIQAKTYQHPKQMQLSSTRSIILFDYDKPIRAFINTNHGHDFDLTYQDSFIKWEGTKGAIRATLGKNINFPSGEADHFTYFLHDVKKEWIVEDIEGHWYPDAFIASMADLLCFLEDPNTPHYTSIDHAIDTMRLVEAAYIANEMAGVNIPD